MLTPHAPPGPTVRRTPSHRQSHPDNSMHRAKASNTLNLTGNILVHRARPPVGDTVTVIRGNRGEPRIPEDPARGLVWRAIEDAVDSRLAWDRFQAGAELAWRGGGPTT